MFKLDFRYNFERLCNNLARVERLTSFRDPIENGYFPKLDSLVSSRTWPPRHSNAILSDVYREIDQIKFDLSDLERWRDRILDAIDQGAITDVSVICDASILFFVGQWVLSTTVCVLCFLKRQH